MKKLVVLILSGMIAACGSTTDIVSANKVLVENYALYKNGKVVSHHVDAQSCKAAAMRANIQLANQANSALRSAKAEPVRGGVATAICQEV